MDPTLEEFSHALALIHEAAASPEQWTQALVALTHLCASSKAAVLDVDASGRFLGFTQVGHDPAAQKEYAEHYHAIDPTLHVAVSGAPHEGLVTYEHFPAAVRARHEYFAYMERYDVGDVIGMSTRGGTAGRSVLSLQRSARAPGFGEDTKRLFRLIAPHLEVAKRVQARVSEAIAGGAALAAGFDRFADAAFIVDGGQAIRFMNAAAQRLVAGDARLRGRGGKLAFAGLRLQAAFEAAVRTAAGKSVRSQILPLRAGDNAPAGEITVCPLAAGHPVASAWQAPLVLVAVTFPRHDAATIAARLRQLHGLTAAEARIVAALALGRSVEEICRDTGVRESTLRSQLKSIRAKTGVSRQAELVRIALGGARLES